MPHALQDSNLHFDVMNIKFYLLSQEFELEHTYLWKGVRREGHLCAHVCRHPHLQEPQIVACSNLHRKVSGLNCSVDGSSGAPHAYFFFLKARRAVMGPAKRGPIWAG